MRALLLAFVIISLAANPLIFSESFYQFLQEDIDSAHSRQVTADTINYFTNDDYAVMSQDYLTNQEAKHMLDVKIVVHALFSFYVLSLLYLLATAKKTWDAVPVASAAVVGILASLTLLPFNIVFTWFHHLFFTKGTWIFPPTSALLAAYPFSFFESFAMWIGGISIIFTLVLLGSWTYLVYRPRRQNES